MLKKNEDIQICVETSCANLVIEKTRYITPTIDYSVIRLFGSIKFTKLNQKKVSST